MVSDSLGTELIPEVHHLNHIIEIHVYGRNGKVSEGWSNTYDKVS